MTSPEYLFVKRMCDERRARGWSQERLVSEVEKRTGLKLNATVITKLEWALDSERADKARGLGVNEALAIARTFDLSLEQMTSLETQGGFLQRELILVRLERSQKETALRSIEAELDDLRQREMALIGKLNTQSVVQTIADARSAIGWSRARLAGELRKSGLPNWHATTVARVEAGQREVRVGEVPIIARALGLSPDMLILLRAVENVGGGDQS